MCSVHCVHPRRSLALITRWRVLAAVISVALLATCCSGDRLAARQTSASPTVQEVPPPSPTTVATTPTAATPTAATPSATVATTPTAIPNGSPTVPPQPTEVAPTATDVPAVPVVEGQRVQGTIEFNGGERTYTLVTPTSAGPIPLIIAMHGGGGSSDQFERTSGLTAVATAAGFAVLYPNGTAGRLGLQTWNAGRCCAYAVAEQVDDVGFSPRSSTTWSRLITSTRHESLRPDIRTAA